MRGFEAVQRTIEPCLRERYWGVSISPSGSFIGSDNPVMMDGPKGAQIGFKSAEVVLFSISRHVLLYGTQVPVRRLVINRNEIARQNTFTMMNAHEQVYSHTPNFCWMDETGKYQTDWKLFSKERLQTDGLGFEAPTSLIALR